MNISLDRHGRAVVAGEGTFRRPESVGQTDVMMNSPAAIAEMIQERDNALTLAQNRQMDREAAQRQAIEDTQAREEMLALDYDNFQSETLREANGGENPMLYIAALQTMAGAVSDYHQPLSGYALSHDGSPEYHRQLSGHSPLRGRMGDFFSDISAQLQSATQSAEAIKAEYLDPAAELVSQVADLLPEAQAADQPGAPAPAPSPAQVKAAAIKAQAGSAWQKFMKQKIGPVPAPALAAVGLLAVVAVIAKSRKRR